MIGTKVASMILDSRQLNFYKVSPPAYTCQTDGVLLTDLGQLIFAKRLPRPWRCQLSPRP